MNNKKQSAQIPGAVWVILGIFVIAIAFLIIVQLPFNEKKPKYEKDHASATAQISTYEDYLRRYEEVEAQIAEMKAEYDTKSKGLYIKPNETADDIQQMLTSTNVSLQSFDVQEGVADASGAISGVGDPLYNTDIRISFTSSREKMIETFKYFESQSKGRYFITNVSVAKHDDRKESSMQSAEKLFDVSMVVRLYYFNEEMNQGLPTESSAESSEG